MKGVWVGYFIIGALCACLVWQNVCHYFLCVFLIRVKVNLGWHLKKFSMCHAQSHKMGVTSWIGYRLVNYHELQILFILEILVQHVKWDAIYLINIWICSVYRWLVFSLAIRTCKQSDTHTHMYRWLFADSHADTFAFGLFIFIQMRSIVTQELQFIVLKGAFKRLICYLNCDVGSFSLKFKCMIFRKFQKTLSV